MKRKSAMRLVFLMLLLPAAGCTTVHDRWTAAKGVDTIPSYEDFLQKYPESQYSVQATSRLETLRLEKDWREANSTDSIEAFEAFLRKHPVSQYTDEAQSRLQQLREQFSRWQSVVQENSLEAYNNFVQFYSDSPYARKASKTIAEWEHDIAGREVVEALESKRVEVEVTGSGIRDVSMKIRRLVDHPVKVTIPIGSYFVCGGSSQNMIGRQEKTITLNDSAWQTIFIPSACANSSLPIPGSSDRFTVQALPRQAELKQLMSVLDEASVPFDVEQAAIWIVTDDAGYADLGVLVSRPAFQAFGGTRVINEDEAAKAMKLCDEAGIEISKKAIWRDRLTILKGIEDETLRETFRDWLRKKEAE